jgi:hypothetical protein
MIIYKYTTFSTPIQTSSQPPNNQPFVLSFVPFVSFVVSNLLALSAGLQNVKEILNHKGHKGHKGKHKG